MNETLFLAVALAAVALTAGAAAVMIGVHLQPMAHDVASYLAGM